MPPGGTIPRWVRRHLLLMLEKRLQRALRVADINERYGLRPTVPRRLRGHWLATLSKGNNLGGSILVRHRPANISPGRIRIARPGQALAWLACRPRQPTGLHAVWAI